MKATPENKVKAQLQKYLKSFQGLFFYSATAGAYSTSGIPDIVGCHNGRFFAIEVKAPGRRNEANRGASGLQVLQMDKIRTAGGFTMVFDGEGEDWFILREFLENTPRKTICWFCGAEMVWGGDFSREDYCLDGEGIVTNLSCSSCGAYAEYFTVDSEG